MTHFSAGFGAHGILTKFDIKRRQIKDLFCHFNFLNMDILRSDEHPVITFYTDVKNTHMEG